MEDNFDQFMASQANQVQNAPQQNSTPAQNDFSQFLQEKPQQPEAQQSALSKIANSAPVDAINAVGGGFTKGIADTIGTAIGSPGVAAALSPNQYAQQGMDRYPGTALTSQMVGAVGAAGATIAGSEGVLAPALGRGLLTNFAANTLAGSVLAGPSNRISGAIGGEVASFVTPIIGSTTGFVAGALSIGTKVKSVVGELTAKLNGPPAELVAKSQANMYNVSLQTENKLFNNFRNVQGDVQVDPILHNASSFLNDNVDELSAIQKKTVMNLIQNVTESKNLADLHDARKIFSYDFGKFTEGRPLTATASQEFRNLNNTVSSVLQNNAEALGVGNEFRTANDFYKNTMLPLINTGAKDTAEALANNTKDPLMAAKITDNLANKYINPARPEETKAFLNTLDPVGRQAMEVHSVSSALSKATSNTGVIDYAAFKSTIQDTQKTMGSIYSDNTNKILTGLTHSIDDATNLAGIPLELNKLGLGYKVSGITATLGVIGYHAGAAAAGGAFMVGAGMMKLLQSQQGQSLLIKAGSEGGRAVGRYIANGLVMQGILNAGQVRESMTPSQPTAEQP